jgi:F-type H+-transporting ATPase subunit b
MRHSWLVGIALTVAVAFWARTPSALAQQPHEPAEKATEHGSAAAEGHGHEGAKQDVASKMFSRALDLSLWTIVVFVILVFVLGKYAWGPMMKGLEAREHAIHSAVEEAHRAREETARLRDEVHQERLKAAEEARATIDQARHDAQKQADELRSKALTEIQAERDRLRRDLELARDAALQDIWSQAARLATVVSGKAIGKQLSPDDHRQLVDEAIAELRTAGADRQRQAASV